MKTKIEKGLKYLAAAIFLFALAINVKVTLDDPFALMSNAALAETTSNSSSNSSSSGVGYYPNCAGLGTPGGPNGGTWSKGTQHEELETLVKYVKANYSPTFSVGFFKSASLAELEAGCAVEATAEVINTAAYTCDSQSNFCCSQVNRYTL